MAKTTRKKLNDVWGSFDMSKKAPLDGTLTFQRKERRDIQIPQRVLQKTIQADQWSWPEYYSDLTSNPKEAIDIMDKLIETPNQLVSAIDALLRIDPLSKFPDEPTRFVAQILTYKQDLLQERQREPDEIASTNLQLIGMINKRINQTYGLLKNPDGQLNKEHNIANLLKALGMIATSDAQTIIIQNLDSPFEIPRRTAEEYFTGWVILDNIMKVLLSDPAKTDQIEKAFRIFRLNQSKSGYGEFIPKSFETSLLQIFDNLNSEQQNEAALLVGLMQSRIKDLKPYKETPMVARNRVNEELAKKSISNLTNNLDSLIRDHTNLKSNKLDSLITNVFASNEGVIISYVESILSEFTDEKSVEKNKDAIVSKMAGELKKSLFYDFPGDAEFEALVRLGVGGLISDLVNLFHNGIKYGVCEQALPILKTRVSEEARRKAARTKQLAEHTERDRQKILLKENQKKAEATEMKKDMELLLAMKGQSFFSGVALFD